MEYCKDFIGNGSGGRALFRHYEAYAFENGMDRQHTGLAPVGMGSLDAQPNYEVRPRVMQDYYLVWLRRGAGELRSEGKRFSLRAKDLYLLFPGVVHAYATDPRDLMEMFWIGFNGADVPQLVETARFSPGAPVFSAAGFPEIEAIMDEMIASGQDTRPSGFYSLCGSLYRLFGKLMALRTPNAPRGDRERAHSRIVNDAHNFLNIHYAQPVAIADVAAHIGVSRATLAALFRKELGVTPSDYLAYVRLKQAANLLKNTTLSIAEVAHSVGYVDALYFSKVFAKRYGMPPSRYRRECAEKAGRREDA